MSTRERAVVAFDREEAERIGTAVRQLMLAPCGFEGGEDQRAINEKRPA